ncbi:hypothetical protein HGK82_22145 [Ochrobactrum sp. MT180101]|nr:hypothetical protein HGK82_22145 [Ochrobactrum sp. MT180101]
MNIPKDIMAIAREVIDSAAFEQFPDGTYPDASYERVARAILAERQRCADVAGTYGSIAGYPDGKTSAFRKHRHRIKAAILAGENHE